MFPPSKQVRWLVDCDSFYASCEVYLNPKLKWLPVCIWGDIVIARSYEAKPYGIKVGTPVREAKKMLPSNAVFLKPHMTKYGQISAQLMSYLSEKCSQVEVFSIDEAFFEISGYDTMYNMSYERIARAMKHDIKKKIWIPVSIWLWPTRLLGKMFAEIYKPFWECVALSPGRIDYELQRLPVADIPFVWPQTQKKLHSTCKSAYDFKVLSYEYVRDLLGKNWLKVWFEMNNINAMMLGKSEKPKSINRTRSFNPHFTTKKHEVRSRLLDNIDKACEHLMDVKMSTRYLTIHFRTKDFVRFGYDMKLPYHTNDKLLITKLARELFEKITFGDVVFRTTGIYLWELTSSRYLQWSLFEDTSKADNHKSLNTVIHSINKKRWRWSIRLGEAKPRRKKNELFELEV